MHLVLRHIHPAIKKEYFKKDIISCFFDQAVGDAGRKKRSTRGIGGNKENN